MASSSIKALESVRRLIKFLNINNIQISKAYVFGSYARKQYNEWSDIDLVLVSDKFEGIMFNDRCKVNPFVVKVDTRIEAHPFNPKDFTEDNPFVKEVIRTGIQIV